MHPAILIESSGDTTHRGDRVGLLVQTIAIREHDDEGEDENGHCSDGGIVHQVFSAIEEVGQRQDEQQGHRDRHSFAPAPVAEHEKDGQDEKLAADQAGRAAHFRVHGENCTRPGLSSRAPQSVRDPRRKFEKDPSPSEPALSERSESNGRLRMTLRVT